MSTAVNVACEGAVATVTLDRPEVRNAFGWDSWAQLGEVLAQCSTDHTVRAVVLTGAGECFSAGGDIKSMGYERPGLLGPVDRLRTGHEVLTRLRELRKPTIAAVEGFAIGVGWSVALSCDLVVAAEDAFFSAPFLQRGLVPDGALIWLLQQRVGEMRAANVFMRGLRLTATQAHELGLVSDVVARGTALTAAATIGGELSQLPADALALAKRLLRRSTTTSHADFLDLEEIAAGLNSYGEDAAEGRAAFLEKRAPQFNRHYRAEG